MNYQFTRTDIHSLKIQGYNKHSQQLTQISNQPKRIELF